MEMVIQQVELHPKGRLMSHEPRTILFFSTQNEEGKTTILNNMAMKLKKQGKKVVVVNFSGESMLQTDVSRMESEDEREPVLEPVLINGVRNKASLKSEEEPMRGKGNRESLTLAKTESNVEEHLIYHVDESYYSIANAADLLAGSQYSQGMSPDYILVELPPILYFPYPSGLVSSADMSIMVCRSNRTWSEADHGALETYMKHSRHKPLFLLNGVEMQVIKSAIGDIPGKQGKVRDSKKRKGRI
jgi:hypothetical protein